MQSTACVARAAKKMRKTEFLLRGRERKRAQMRCWTFVTSVVLGFVYLISINQTSISSQIEEYLSVFLMTFTSTGRFL